MSSRKNNQKALLLQNLNTDLDKAAKTRKRRNAKQEKSGAVALYYYKKLLKFCDHLDEGDDKIMDEVPILAIKLKTELSLIRGMTCNAGTELVIPDIYNQLIDIYNYFYQCRGADTFTIRKNYVLEMMNIVVDAELEDLMINTYSDAFELASNHFLTYFEDPEFDEKAHFELIKIIFRNMIQLIVSKKQEALSPDEKKELANHESDASKLMLENMLTMHLRHPEQVQISSMLALLEQADKAKITCDSQLYASFLQLILNTEKPNLNFIWFCFKGLLNNARTSSDPANILDEEIVTTTFNALKKSAQENIMNQLTEFKNEDFIKIILMFESVRQLKLPLSPNLWYDFLSILYAHRTLLTKKQHENIYVYAALILKIEDVFENVLYEKTDSINLFNLIFLLMSSSSDPNLSPIRELYTRAKAINPNAQFFQAVITKILLKAQNFLLNDFDFFFTEISHDKPEDTRRLFIHLFQGSQNIQSDELISFCNRHIETIMADKNICNHLLKTFSSEFLTQLTPAETLLREHETNINLQEFKATLTVKLRSDQTSQYFRKVVLAFLHYIESLDAVTDYLPSEKKLLLDIVLQELNAFRDLEIRAAQNHIKTNRFKLRFIEFLQQNSFDISQVQIQLQSIRQSYQQEIETQEARIIEAKANAISLEAAWGMLKEGGLQNLEKINTHLIINPQNIQAHLIKIRCLVALGYYDQALIWLEKTTLNFPGKHTKSLLKSWAESCIAYGQYSVALDTYQRIHDLESSNDHHITDLSIAFCHELVGKSQNVENALSIYDRLLRKQLSVEEHTKIKRKKILCLIKHNQFLEAKKIIDTLPAQEKDPETQALLGCFYLQQNEYAVASTWYKKALQTRNKLSWIQSLIYCYHFDSKANPEDKKALIATLEKNTEATQQALRLKVLIYMEIRNFHKALEVIGSMTQTWGKNQFTYTQTALCDRSLYRTEKAINQLLEFPDYRQNRTILKHLAVTYSMNGMQQKALEAYDYLLTEFPSYAFAYPKAIAYCIKIEDKTRVMRYWAQCQESCAEHQNLLASLQRLIDTHYPDGLQSSSDNNQMMEIENILTRPDEEEKLLLQDDVSDEDEALELIEFDKMNISDCASTDVQTINKIGFLATNLHNASNLPNTEPQQGLSII